MEPITVLALFTAIIAGGALVSVILLIVFNKFSDAWRLPRWSSVLIPTLLLVTTYFYFQAEEKDCERMFADTTHFYLCIPASPFLAFGVILGTASWWIWGRRRRNRQPNVEAERLEP